MNPSYKALSASGELRRRSEKARQILSCCTLCPRQCRVNRTAGELGICQIGSQAPVADFAPHFGEEGPLVGSRGSGTVFFSRCNLLCVFCQNFEISHVGQGTIVSDRQLADIMLDLQQQGCHNINLVTPTHVVPQILAALDIAAADGLNLPLVYNNSSYECVETLALLDGVIDIYMPDFKFWSPESAKRYANAPDYPERAREAVIEMQRQVGELVVDEQGLAVRGLLLRHLVMPDGLAETEEILHFIATKISPHTYVNIMDQYRPCGYAVHMPSLYRSLSTGEYRQALKLARQAGLTRLDKRDFSGLLHRLFAAGDK